MNKWLEPVSSAWVGVVTHKLRSFLTMLGIIIGVGAVIALMSIGRGAESDILSQIEDLGSDLVFVSPVKSTLTQDDAEAIAESISYVGSVSPAFYYSSQLIVGKENINAQVIGVTPSYAEALNVDTSSGSFFSEYDYQRGARVAVIGANIAEELFEGTTATGQEIRMGSNILLVMGVIEKEGATPGGTSPDDSILIPMTAMQQIVPQKRTSRGANPVHMIALVVTEEGQSEYVVDEVSALLRSRHQLSPEEDDDFNIISMEEIASMVSEILGTMTLFLGAVAAISLLVGGIGVMNIMLVTVLERTREIGIRKALGARERDIWGQFLLEAAFLSFGGGVIGIVLGWTASSAVGRLVEEINPIISPDIIILAASVSIGIGLFFGFLPAWNASRLKPIEALRAE